MRGAQMDKSGYNSPSWHLMSMSVYNLVGLRCHGRFYTGVIIHCHQQWLSKGSLGMGIPRIVRVITICDEVFFKLRVYFDGLEIRKKVLTESSNCIEKHLDVVVEVLEVQRSIAFEFCLDEEFIEFWWADLMFEIPHATNFFIISTLQWWIPIDI